MKRVLVGFTAILLLHMMATGALAQTLLPLLKDWSNEGGWHVYYAQKGGARSCYGESLTGDGIMLLGASGDDGQPFFGFAGERTGELKPKSIHEVDLSFDGRSSWRAKMQAIDFNGIQMLFGDYINAGGLRRDIAAGSVVVAKVKQRRLASLSLKGTSAALKAIDACVAAMRAGQPETAPITTQANKSNRTSDTQIAEVNRLFEEADGLYDAGQLGEAEQLYRQVLVVRRRVLGAGCWVLGAGCWVLSILKRF